jgi:hypothetical protein
MRTSDLPFLDRFGRMARTLRHTHPLQLAARPSVWLAPLLRDVPSALAPLLVERWPAARPALRALAQQERVRGRDRLARLRSGSRLRTYEECYGLECADDDVTPREAWRTRAAIEPYPASMRARRLAVGARLGARGAREELARAARAILVRPEVHLLGNHLLENGFGLACAGAVARGAEADMWWRAGVALLAWQLDAQFLEDGGHVERSASYHLALLAALLESIELADSSGRIAPAVWRAVATRALTWAMTVRAPDGTYPLFNDAALDAAPSMNGVLALGRELGLSAADGATPSSVSGVTIVRIEPTGWLRVDAADGACLFIDVGPDAEGWQPGHAHADGLTFELWIDGKRTVVDFGVASYEVDESRRETRATRSHNTVEVDGLDSCEVWAAFRVGRRGRGQVLDVEVSDNRASLRLEHDGYAWLPGAPRHVRTMTMAAGSLHVLDRAEGGSHAMVSRLRTSAAGAPLRVGNGRKPVESIPGVWHARHGEPLRARVFEQVAASNNPYGIAWHLEW